MKIIISPSRKKPLRLAPAKPTPDPVAWQARRAMRFLATHPHTFIMPVNLQLNMGWDESMRVGAIDYLIKNEGMRLARTGWLHWTQDDLISLLCSFDHSAIERGFLAETITVDRRTLMEIMSDSSAGIMERLINLIEPA